MSLVVDVSIAIAWVLPDERCAASDQLLRGLAGSMAHVPSIFWHELRNSFLVAERRGRLQSGGARLSMLEIRNLPLADAGQGSDQSVLALAVKHALTAYDSAYLALALSRGLPLATNDRRMAAAAHVEQVPVRGLS